MRANPVKAALRRGEPQIGTWLTIGDVAATRVLARCGFTWLTVDLEHAAIDWSRAATLFGAIADAGCTPLARVPEGRHDHIKRCLDAGAHGIVAPMIETATQARAVIAACKYPPQGNRSVGGSLHALNFDAPAGEYFRRANDEVLVVLQTESPRGVDNAAEIYGLPGVDAIFVGPNDLRAQMRTPSQMPAPSEMPVPSEGQGGDAFEPPWTDPTPEEFEAMLGRIRAAGDAAGVPVGLHVQTSEDVVRRCEEGWRFIAYASDLGLMTRAASEGVAAVGLSGGDDLARY